MNLSIARRSIPVGCAVLALCGGCGGHAAPAPSSPNTPAFSPPVSRNAPWLDRLSVAEGYEAPATDKRTYAIRGATLMLATGRTIARGTIVLSNGKIASVTEGDAPAPAGAVVIDGKGKFVTPGIIDTHSHLGVYPMPGVRAHEDGNEMTEPVTPQAQSVDAFWPQDPGIERAVAGGVTTIQVLPGSGNLVGGRAFTIKLRPATSPRAMHFAGAPDGLKMACGENPKRVYGRDKKAPMTRMGNLALQRAAFLKAKKLAMQWEDWREAESQRAVVAHRKEAAYEKKRAAGKDDASPPDPSRPALPPDRDPGSETLAAAMAGRVLVQVHCYRADDMMAMLSLADEVGFKVRSFHHALEAYKIRGELARREIASSTWADWWGFKLEAYDGIPENAALLAEAGGKVVIHSDSDEGIQRLNQEAGKALAAATRAGIRLTEENAIQWLTSVPAWVLGVDARVGTLEVGKDADVVLWSEDPFSVYAAAERVWIDGALVHTRGAPGWSDFELGQLASMRSPWAPPARPGPAPGAPLAWPTPLVKEKDAPAPKVDGRRRPIAIAGGTVFTGASGAAPLEGATVVVEDGVVRAVGKGIAVPANADIIDARGRIVSAGLVDVLTGTGLVEIDLEPSTRDDDLAVKDPIRAAFRASDGYNPASSLIPVTRIEGLTSVGVVPSGGLVSGQSAWADLDGTRTADALAAAPLAIHVDLGGHADRGGHAGALRHVREAFDDARTFAKTRGAFERNQSRAFSAGRLDLEALTRTEGGKLPVVFHVDRAADIVSALALAREFGLRPVIAGGAEAWMVRTELAAAKVPVIVLPLLPGPISFEALGAREDNAALLHGAGVPVILSTSETHNARKLRQVAGNAVRAGLPHAAALASITRAPADAFGLGARYGTIETGKVANLVVWSGDPLAIQSRAIAMLVRGRQVPLTSRQTNLFEKYR